MVKRSALVTLMLAAFVVGILTSITACEMRATVSSAPVAAHRFVVVVWDTPDNFQGRSVILLHDTKAGGCYLATDWASGSYSGAMALTLASPTACLP